MKRKTNSGIVLVFFSYFEIPTQLKRTYLKSAIETLEKVVKYVQS